MGKFPWESAFICAMFINLSKGFDTMDLGLWIAKLGAYGFQDDVLSSTQ